MSKTSHKEPPISIYLGTSPEKQRRIKSLDELADERGISRSELIQLIADGTIPLGDKNGSAPKYVAKTRYEAQPA